MRRKKKKKVFLVSRCQQKGRQRKAGVHAWGIEVKRGFSLSILVDMKLPAMRLIWQADDIREIQDLIGQV